MKKVISIILQFPVGPGGGGDGSFKLVIKEHRYNVMNFL